MRRLLAGMCGALLGSSGAAWANGTVASDIRYDFHVRCTPENAIFGHYSATKQPVVVVPSGAVVRIDGGGGVRGGRRSAPTSTDVAASPAAAPVPAAPSDPVADTEAWAKENNIPLDDATRRIIAEIAHASKEAPRPEGISGGHFLIGPVYIEDAEPGDSLEVRILDVTPRLPFGSNGARPGGGGLPDLVPRPFNKAYYLDLKRNAAVYDGNIEIPLGPFNGVNGTCPPDSEGPLRRSTQPGVFGGNLDSKDLVAGSTLYLPVFQKGALFYTGDCHAAQGDGEIAGDAIGTANTCTYQFILHKGKTLKGPRAETPTHYIAYGLDPDLNVAMRNAMVATIEFLSEKQGFNFMQSYTLISAAIDFRVTQIVDKTLGIHGMIPKRIFVNDPNTYWYRPF